MSEKKDLKEKMGRRQALGNIISLGVGTLCCGAMADVFSGPSFVTDGLKHPELEKILEKEYQVRIIGNTSEQNLTKLKEALENMDKALIKFRQHLLHVHYIDLPYRFPLISLLFPFGAALSIHPTKVIKFIKDINPKYLAHELGHFWYHSLENKEEFNRKWKKIANIEYKYSLSGVPNGCVSDYGASNLLEDVAEFCYDIFRISNGLQKKEIPLRHPIKDTEKRFIEKAGLLCEYGFITPEEFEIVKPYYTKDAALYIQKSKR